MNESRYAHLKLAVEAARKTVSAAVESLRLAEALLREFVIDSLQHDLRRLVPANLTVGVHIILEGRRAHKGVYYWNGAYMDYLDQSQWGDLPDALRSWEHIENVANQIASAFQDADIQSGTVWFFADTPEGQAARAWLEKPGASPQGGRVRRAPGARAR